MPGPHSESAGQAPPQATDTADPMADELVDDAAASGVESDQRIRRVLHQALTSMRSKQFAEAASLLQSIADEPPPRPGVLLNLGIAQAQLGDDVSADRTLRRVIELEGGNSIAYNQLGILLRKRGQFLAARQAYQQALEVKPDYSLAHLNLAILCDLYLQRSDCALHHYRQYQRLSDGQNPEVQLWIEDLQRQEQRQQTGRAVP